MRIYTIDLSEYVANSSNKVYSILLSRSEYPYIISVGLAPMSEIRIASQATYPEYTYGISLDGDNWLINFYNMSGTEISGGRLPTKGYIKILYMGD